MRIALVIYEYSDSKGGVERYVSDLSKELVKQGHSVHIFYHKTDEPIPSKQGETTFYKLPRYIRDEEDKKEPAKQTPGGITFHQVPVSGKFYSPFKLLSFASNSAKMLKEEKFDIIQGFGRTYHQDILRFGSGCHWEYLKQRHPSMNNPLGRFVQRINPRNRIIMNLEKQSLAAGNYKKVICISNLVKREIQQYYQVPEQDIKVIYNGINPERFTPANRDKHRKSIRKELNISDKEIVMLFVGSGFERKGLQYAIESLSVIDKNMPTCGEPFGKPLRRSPYDSSESVGQDKRSESVKLVVIGKGNVAKYRFMAEIRGIGERVLFVGTKPNIERYYAASDIFIFPSLYDAFGTAVLEAMASGLPSLVSNQSGASEVINHGVDSFVINPRNTQEIAKHINHLSDPVWRENMGKVARATALKYSFERNLQATLEVYQEVINKD